MDDPAGRADMDWRGQAKYPRPDYLSSSRKRLAPQLIFKGGILNAWGRKMAVALNRGFYETLPTLEEVDKSEADIAWLIYDLQLDAAQNRYQLVRHKIVYSRYAAILGEDTGPLAPCDEDAFLRRIEARLDAAVVDEE